MMLPTILSSVLRYVYDVRKISHTTEYSTTVKGSNKSILQRKLAEI